MVAIILSSKIIESNLKAEFGEILPVELPIRNKQLLTHQIESLTEFCDSIYLTVPRGYASSLTREVTPIEMDPGYGLIDVFREISRRFPPEQKLFIYYGDSLFLNIKQVDLSRNYFFVQQPIYQYGWGISNENGLVPAGGIIIDNQTFIELLEKADNFDGLTRIIKDSDKIIPFSDFEWLDFGHTLTYYYSRKRFLESRSFNRLNAKDGFIIKSSNDVLKMWCEYKWLFETKKRMPANVPYVTDFNMSGTEASYSIEYINHPILSDIFVFGKLSEEFILRILDSIQRILIKFRSIVFDETLMNGSDLYAEKLTGRKKEILAIAKALDSDETYIAKLIDENISYFANRRIEYVPMHGDLCFSNILFNFSTFEPILIDPRGYTSPEKGFSISGPANYDIYKLAHSYVMGYDFLIAGLSDHPFFEKNSIYKRLDLFCSIFECDKEDLIMGLKNLFLSMLPLHKGAIERQKSFIRVLYLIDEL